jgi:succinate dehydrogenase/fumarate reductase flavoprotein subunit
MVAGAGMAGLACAARARELGADPSVLEKGTRPGGSMLLSSCVIWRHRTFELFREECPGGDEALQRLVWEGLDAALEWLQRLGAPVVAAETGNERTAGVRFDPRGLMDALVRAAGRVRLDKALGTTDEPLVLATGGFAADGELVARYIAPAAPLPLRANPWSDGGGLRFGLDRNAALSAGLDEFYGRNMADVPFSEEQFVQLAQLYGRFARVFDEQGVEFFDGEVSWSENDLVQATARRPNARAWYVLDAAALEQRVRERTVGQLVEAARAAGGTVLPASELPFAPPGAVVAVRVQASITHTIGGLRINPRARVLREDGSAVPGLYAAGADVGGISTGGYASGLAAALVLGRTAAESAVADAS